MHSYKQCQGKMKTLETNLQEDSIAVEMIFALKNECGIPEGD